MANTEQANRDRLRCGIWGPRPSWYLAIFLAIATIGDGQTASGKEPRRGTLTLNEGDTIEGYVVQGESTDAIGWQGVHFVDPFEFRMGTIRTIKFENEDENIPIESPLSFELTTGDVLLGRLVSLTSDAVEIDVDSVGVVAIHAGLLRRIQRMDDNAAVTFSSLRGMQGWSNAGPEEGAWVEDGDQIWTQDAGASVTADLALPPRAVVDFELSWSNAPDFVVAVGVDADGDADAERDGWRLETAGDTLAIVHETADRADVQRVADLSKLGRIRLIVYVDQERGEMAVLRSDGTSIGRIAIPEVGDRQQEAAAKTAKRGLRIVNRGQSLRLERFQIAKWVGGIPGDDSQSSDLRGADMRGRASIALADGTVLSGRIQSFDAATDRLNLADSARAPAVPLEQVVSIRFSPRVGSVEPGPCAMFLHGGMRLSGQISGVDLQGWRLTGSPYLDEIRLPHDQVRTIVFFESEAAGVEVKPVLGRVGRLEMAADRCSGRLVDESPSQELDPEVLPLRWHPLTSNKSARLRGDAAGKIVYRDPPKFDSQSAAAQMLAQQRLRNQQQRRGLNFGELFLRRADLTKSSPVKRDAHVVHLRSGDVVACRVDEIDENGVFISTASSDRRFVPHSQMKAIEFVSNSPPPNLDEAKRERLLTIPRLQKNLPPSHLLCSHNGDFLRCRLLGTKDEMLRVEIQLEEFLIPRNRIAQIIWFHDAEQSEANEPATPLASDLSVNPYRGLVQAVMNDGKRVTFEPSGVQSGLVVGTSQWIGACQFDLGSVDQLLIGAQIPIEVADISYNRWKLQPAVEPLVTAAMEGDSDASASQQSSLVGAEAPNFRLPLLSGGTFDLSNRQGQTTVLVFWASWSAPSMQTLPLASEAIGQFDSSLVRMIAVNLQEPAEQVAAAMKRMQLKAEVALDTDGEAAQRYQTSVLPQMVLVGPDGKVAGLYLGGGKDSIEKLMSDLRK